MTNYKFDKLHHGCGEPLAPLYRLPKKQHPQDVDVLTKAVKYNSRKITGRTR